MTDKEFKAILNDILNILDQSEDLEEAIKQIKEKYLEEEKQ